MRFSRNGKGVAMKSESHTKSQRHEGFLSASMMRRAVPVGVFVGMLVLLGLWHLREPDRESVRTPADEQVPGGMSGFAAESEEGFSLGLCRVHRKPPAYHYEEEEEVPYFLKRVDISRNREVIIRSISNVGTDHSADFTVNELLSSSVVFGLPPIDGEIGDGSPASKRLEDAPDHPPGHGE